MNLALRRPLAVLAAAAVVLSPSVWWAGPSYADVQSQCTGQDKVIIKRVENVRKKFVPTHVEAITLSAGSAYSEATTLIHAETLKAKTNITSEVGGSANWGFASVEAKVGISVAAEGAKTTTSSVTKTFSIPAKNKDRRFALFTGNYQVKGRWHYLSCSRAPGQGTEKWGPIETFGGRDTGTVLCPRSRYATSDYRYGIARAAGC
ncbi:hypothetical protein [Nocardioides psychrotolerans]|uniref:hypothetical protein n=1 Tax=Nocardioides psychrotolerans TaxID=1005945 RepID=UPI003137D936